MTTGLIIATPAHAGLLFANAGALIFNMYQMSSVGNSRKATGLKYPAEFWPHADEEKDHAKLVFNCKQRAHHVSSLRYSCKLNLKIELHGEYPNIPNLRQWTRSVASQDSNCSSVRLSSCSSGLLSSIRDGQS